MNALALYANTIMWLFLVSTYERHGSVMAHKIRVVLAADFRCPCRICHPAAVENNQPQEQQS
jgi:hypothetical protein